MYKYNSAYIPSCHERYHSKTLLGIQKYNYGIKCHLNYVAVTSLAHRDSLHARKCSSSVRRATVKRREDETTINELRYTWRTPNRRRRSCQKRRNALSHRYELTYGEKSRMRTKQLRRRLPTRSPRRDGIHICVGG